MYLLNSELNFVSCVWFWCSGYSLLNDLQYNKGLTDALVIQLTLYCQPVLAVMLAKTGVSAERYKANINIRGRHL